MNADFPASHSMDTRWFASDEGGHLGIFRSGENGHVPDIGAGNTEELIEELWQRHLAGEGESPWEGEELADKLGVYYYDYDESFDPIAPYKRTAVPTTPLHVDQLTPALRKQAKTARLVKVDFALHELLQPLEHYACIYWYDEDRVAYLCGDGKTMRPIPGMEGKFAELCKRFREEQPEEARIFIFEAPEEKPKQPRPRGHEGEGEEGH